MRPLLDGPFRLRAPKETSMQLPHGAHVAVADGNRFVLFRNDGDAEID